MNQKLITPENRIYGRESIGGINNHRTVIEIYADAGREFTDEEKAAFGMAGDMIAKAIGKGNLLLSEKYRQDGEEATARLIGLFGDRKIFIERIENQYWPENIHEPWLIVTTDKGHIMIGWRKRVISIDWSRSVVSASADELFPGENVTKDGRSIHAYGYEKAQEYIDKILGATL